MLFAVLFSSAYKIERFYSPFSCILTPVYAPFSILWRAINDLLKDILLPFLALLDPFPYTIVSSQLKNILLMDNINN